MADLIDRISGEVDPTRKINTHRLLGAWNLYVSGYLTRSQVSDLFGITGNVDEARQANQIADNLDAKQAGLELLISTGNITWSNMPSGLTEFAGVVHRRTRAFLSAFEQVRLVARISTIGAVNAILFGQYSTNESAWSTLTTNLAVGGGSAGTRASTFQDVPAGAKTGEVFIRVVGQSGDAAADPIIGNLSLQFTVPWDKGIYTNRVEGVCMAIEDINDTLFHDGNRNIVKSTVFTALQIAG